MGFFGTSAPTKVETDTVVPLPFFDDSQPWKAFVLYSMFVFDDVLDVNKLRDSLATLAQRPGWRKLSARLRRDGSNFVYHMPASFSDSRPAINYSHIVHKMTAAEHPVASKLPHVGPAGTRPEIVGNPDDFRPLFHNEDAPLAYEEYLTKDMAQMGLHVVSFTDKTIVTIYWPHTMMDAMGKRALLDAWTLVLQGRADELPEPEGGDDGTDPLATLGTAPTEPYLLADKVLSLLGLGGYALRNIGNFTRTHEHRMLRVPAAFLASLRAQADADLTHLPAGPEKPAYISDGDILAAWWGRMATQYLVARGDGAARPVVLNMAMSLRKCLADDLFRKPRPALWDDRVTYISNAVSFACTQLTLGELAAQPLGATAAQIRRALDTLRTRPQVEAFMYLWRNGMGKMPPMVGEAGMHMVTVSNWCQARLYETDLSAAVLSSSEKKDDVHKPGRPTYLQNTQFGLTLPDGFPVIGKDAYGNVWLSGYMNPGVWGQVEAELAKE